MSENTKIEWCDHSWSPWRGCTKVSPGCANCYAETLSKRNPAVLGQWGRGKPRVLAKNWGDPVRWNKAAELGECRCCGSRRDTSGTGNCKSCGEVRRIYTRPSVFPSLCDWLDPEVPVEWLAKFLALIQSTPNMTWLLLTKRPESFSDRINGAVRVIQNHDLALWASTWIDTKPPANVWIGTSVEDQKRADERIPSLLAIPAAGRFLSVEPLLGPVDLSRRHRPQSPDGRPLWPTSEPMLFGIHWIIIGGESGRGARPCNVDWIRSLVRQCKGASVPVFVKQLGAVPMEEWWEHSPECEDDLCANGGGIGDCAGQIIESRLALSHPKGGDPAEWPEDLRVREFPEGLR